MFDQIIALIVAVACYTGTLSQYDRSPTEMVLDNRSVVGQTAYTLPENHAGVSGYIAVYDCEWIGQVVTVSWANHVERLMVFDCAGDDETRQWMKRGNVIGEVDFYTARRWGMLRQGIQGATLCPAEVGKYLSETLTR
jgi:hypothetical protein